MSIRHCRVWGLDICCVSRVGPRPRCLSPVSSSAVTRDCAGWAKNRPGGGMVGRNYRRGSWWPAWLRPDNSPRYPLLQIQAPAFLLVNPSPECGATQGYYNKVFSVSVSNVAKTKKGLQVAGWKCLRQPTVFTAPGQCCCPHLWHARCDDVTWCHQWLVYRRRHKCSTSHVTTSAV